MMVGHLLGTKWVTYQPAQEINLIFETYKTTLASRFLLVSTKTEDRLAASFNEFAIRFCIQAVSSFVPLRRFETTLSAP